jgi:NAD-dependent SIR2 family protein deacetylase
MTRQVSEGKLNDDQKGDCRDLQRLDLLLSISTSYSQHPAKLYQMYLEMGSGKDTLYTNLQKPAWFRGIATFRNEQQLYHVPRPSMVKS